MIKNIIKILIIVLFFVNSAFALDATLVGNGFSNIDSIYDQLGIPFLKQSNFSTCGVSEATKWNGTAGTCVSISFAETDPIAMPIINGNAAAWNSTYNTTYNSLQTFINQTFLNISTYNGDFPNTYLTSQNFAAWNSTCIDCPNATITSQNLLAWNATYNTTYDAKEPAITGSTGNVFWNGLKTFISLDYTNITGFNATVQSIVNTYSFLTNITMDRNLANFTNTYGWVNNSTMDKNYSNLSNIPTDFPNTTVANNLITWNSTYNISYDDTNKTVNGNLVNWNNTYNASYLKTSDLNSTMDRNLTNYTSANLINVNGSTYWNNLLTPSSVGISGQYLVTNGEGNTTWTDMPPSGSTQTMWLYNSTSNVVPYASKNMNRTVNTTSVVGYSNITTLANGNTFIQNWTSQELGYTKIPEGLYNLHVESKTSGISTTRLIRYYFLFSIVNQTGYGNASYHVSENSAIITNDGTEQDPDMDLLVESVVVNSTDRIKISLYATQSGVGTQGTLITYYGDATDASLTIPFAGVDLTPLVSNVSILQSQVAILNVNSPNSTVANNLANWNNTYNFTYDTLQTGKEPTITGSTNNVFWNGLKAWVTLDYTNISGFNATVTSIANSLGFITSSYNVSYDNTNKTVAGNLANWNSTYNVSYDSNITTVQNNLVNWNATYNQSYDNATYRYVEWNIQSVTTGNKGKLMLPQGTIVEAFVSSTEVGNINVSFWKTAFGNSTPTATNVIGWINMSNNYSVVDTTLTGFSSTSVLARDMLVANVYSTSTLTNVTFGLTIRN